MDEVFVDLTGVEPFHIFNGIGEHLRAIVSHPLNSNTMLLPGFMGSACAITGFFEGILCFLGREAAKK